MISLYLIKFLLFRTIESYDIISHYSFENLNSKCEIDVLCFEKNNVFCLGNLMPYNSIGSVNNTPNEYAIQNWNVLEKIPKCWPYIQFYLCSYAYPLCKNNKIQVLSVSNCRLIKYSCRFLLKNYNPYFLNCSLSSNQCPSSMYNFENSSESHSCLSPLVYSNVYQKWHKDIDFCGYPCKLNSYNYDFDKVFYGIYTASNFLTIIYYFLILIIFIMNFKKQMLNYINLPLFIGIKLNILSIIPCLMVNYENIRYSIACSADGTSRSSITKNDITTPCNLSFILIYFSTLSSQIWNLINTNQLSRMKRKNKSYLLTIHCIAWGIPLVLLILTYAFSQIVGSYRLGICFLNISTNKFDLFILVPIFIISLLGLYISSVKCKDKSVIKGEFYFWLICSIIIIICYFIKISVTVLENSWHENNFDNYLWCQIYTKINYPNANYPGLNECKLKYLDADDTSIRTFYILACTLVFIYRNLVGTKILWNICSSKLYQLRSSQTGDIDSDPNNDSDCDYDEKDEFKNEKNTKNCLLLYAENNSETQMINSWGNQLQYLPSIPAYFDQYDLKALILHKYARFNQCYCVPIFPDLDYHHKNFSHYYSMCYSSNKIYVDGFNNSTNISMNGSAISSIETLNTPNKYSTNDSSNYIPPYSPAIYFSEPFLNNRNYLLCNRNCKGLKNNKAEYILHNNSEICVNNMNYKHRYSIMNSKIKNNCNNWHSKDSQSSLHDNNNNSYIENNLSKAQVIFNKRQIMRRYYRIAKKQYKKRLS